MSASMLRHWSAPSRPHRHAAELMPVADCAILASALCQVAPAIGHSVFLIVRVDRFDSPGFLAAMRSFRHAGGGARLVLASDRTTLEAADAAGFDPDDLGLMLDDATAETPPSHLIWDRIEAVRFCDDFVRAANGNLRLGYALELMLGLARDLGLCTLGSAGRPGDARVADRPNFDYVHAGERAPWPLAVAARLPRRHAQGGKARRQPTRDLSVAGNGTDRPSR